MRVVSILPGAIVGPADNGPTGLGGMLISAGRRELPAVPPGALAFVDVRDVARAMLAAVTRGSSGARYCVAGRPLPIKAVVDTAAALAGVKPPAFTLPYAMAWLFGLLSEVGARLTGRPPQATRILIATLNESARVSSAKAERELGVTFRPIETSVRDGIAWFRAHGYL